MTKLFLGGLLAAALLPPLASAEEAQVRVTATLAMPTCTTTIGDYGATSSERKSYNVDFGSILLTSAIDIRSFIKRIRVFINDCNVSPGAITTLIPELVTYGNNSNVALQSQSDGGTYLMVFINNVKADGERADIAYKASWDSFEITDRKSVV